MNINEGATGDALKRRIRVLYSLPDGAQSSVLLRTTHLRRLIEARDVDWTFVSPLATDAEFAAEFREAGVNVVEWPKIVTPPWERLLLVLRQEFWRRRIDNESSKIYAERSRWFAPKRYHVNRWAIP